MRKNGWDATTITPSESAAKKKLISTVDICSNVTIGAGAVVTRDITHPGTYVGNPARRVIDWQVDHDR